MPARRDGGAITRLTLIRSDTHHGPASRRGCVASTFTHPEPYAGMVWFRGRTGKSRARGEKKGPRSPGGPFSRQLIRGRARELPGVTYGTA